MATTRNSWSLGALGRRDARRHITIMTEAIFDRRAVRLHHDRAAKSVERVAAILDDVAERLLDRLDDTTKRFGQALDLGGRGMVAGKLRARGIATVTCEVSPSMAARDVSAVAGDAEFLPFAPESFDLVVANLSLHWADDLLGALIQLRQALRPDGLLLASLPALGTLGELRAALTEAEASLTGGVSPRVSPFASLPDCAGLMQRAGFALPVVDGDVISLRYADPVGLLHDLRAAGEANSLRLRDHRPAPRSLFPMALAALPQQDGRTVATLRIAILTGWAPAPTQPRPIARGSAAINLEDALKDD